MLVRVKKEEGQEENGRKNVVTATFTPRRPRTWPPASSASSARSRRWSPIRPWCAHRSAVALHSHRHTQDDGIVYDALVQLQKAAMTLELLQETKIGVAVNAVSKGCAGKGSDLAKELIKSWKALLPASSSNTPSKPGVDMNVSHAINSNY